MPVVPLPSIYNIYYRILTLTLFALHALEPKERNSLDEKRRITHN